MSRTRYTLVVAVALLAAPAAAQPPRADLHGDPLPHGAVARLGTIRLRGTDKVSALAFSPDGKRLASRAGNHVQLWDAATGKELWLAHHGIHYGDVLTFSPDGSRILTAGRTGGVRIWDAADGKLLGEYGTDQTHAVAVACSPDGQQFAGALDNGVVFVASTSRQNEKRRVIVADDGDLKLAWSPDGKYVAVGGTKGRVYICPTAEASKEPVAEIQADGPVLLLAFPAEGDGIFVATGKSVSLVSRKGGPPLRTFEQAPKVPAACRLSADGKRFAVAAMHEPGSVRVWDVATGKLLRSFDRGRSVGVCALAPDCTTVAQACWDQRIDLFDVATGKLQLALDGHGMLVEHLTWSPDGKTLTTAASDGDLCHWDASGKLLRRTFHGDRELYPVKRCLTAGGKLATRGADNKLCLWDAPTGQVERYPVLVEKAWDVRDVAASGKVVVLCTEGEVVLWDVGAAKVRQRFGPLNHPRTGALAPDERSLLTVDDTAVTIWDTASGKVRWRKNGSLFFFFQCWAPDCQQALFVELLLYGNFSNYAVLDGLATKGKRHELLETRELCSGAFSPDGSLLALAHLGGEIALVESASRLMLSNFSAHHFRGESISGDPQQLGALAWSPDGKRLAVAVADGSVLIFDLHELFSKPTGPLTRGGAEELWDTLAGGDGPAVLRGLLRLTGTPQQAVTLLRSRLRPVAHVSAERLQALVADLDAKEFARRDAATKELAALGNVAEAALEKLRDKPPSEEARRRAELLLDGLAKRYTQFPSPALRAERALQVLEWLATPEARQLLETLAAGEPRARQTRLARAALERLTRR
jgi:WD40 repeat protein